MRKDGRRVSGASPMYTVASYFMKKRYDAQNMIEVDVPLNPIGDYIRAKRAEGKKVSHLGVLIAAYLRTAAEFPLLNRFIVNKRAYSRTEFTCGMVVLKPGELDGTMNKMHLELEDDIFRVQEVLDSYIDQNRETGDTNSTDKVIAGLLRVPGILTFGVGLFKLLDHLGLLPKAIIDASPFHTSMVISNLASIQTNHIYHHCYQFGTTSIIITVGVPKEVPRRHGKNITFERCLPLGVVMDERICSGSYFAAAFSRFREYLMDPTLLEGPSAHPVIREWAKPGEYEAMRAKKIFRQEKKRIHRLPKAERAAALRAAKATLKASLDEAKAIKQRAKAEKRAKKKEA
ncbi:MAG: hypothetical protein J6S44_03320 [Clostridia bacterium]|nr:hypothetical protein [Clostridia bacterium]